MRCNSLPKRKNKLCMHKNCLVLFISLLNNIWKLFFNQNLDQNSTHSQSFSLSSFLYKNLFQSCNKFLINLACSGPYWENIGLRSFLYGPRCAWSVLSRPLADILPVRPSRLVNKMYTRCLRDVAEKKEIKSPNFSMYCIFVLVHFEF